MKKIDVKILRGYFDKYSCRFDIMPTKTQLTDLDFYISKSFYNKLLGVYTDDFLAVVLKYLEDKEEYEICAKILKGLKVKKLRIDECK